MVQFVRGAAETGGVMAAHCDECFIRRSRIAAGLDPRWSEPMCAACRTERHRKWLASPESKPRPETRLEQAHRELGDLAEYLVALAEVVGCAKALSKQAGDWAGAYQDAMGPGFCRSMDDTRRALKRLDAAK